MTKPTRSYSNGVVVVEWRPERCVHCQACIRALPAVFNVLAKPWVNMEAATTEEIKTAVDECPSQALSWRNDDYKPEAEC